MKRRLIGFSMVAAATALLFAYAAQDRLAAQATQPAAKQDPATKPTPHLADGHPDLNGTYFHEGGVSFIRPRKLADGSVCFFGCPPGKGGPPPKGEVQGPPIPPPAPSFPKYKPGVPREGQGFERPAGADRHDAPMPASRGSTHRATVEDHSHGSRGRVSL